MSSLSLSVTDDLLIVRQLNHIPSLTSIYLIGKIECWGLDRSPKSATATINCFIRCRCRSAQSRWGSEWWLSSSTPSRLRAHCHLVPCPLWTGVRLVVWSKQSVPLGGRAGNHWKVCGPEPVLRTWIVIIAQGEIGVLGIRMICCGNLWIPSWIICSWQWLSFYSTCAAFAMLSVGPPQQGPSADGATQGTPFSVAPPFLVRQTPQKSPQNWHDHLFGAQAFVKSSWCCRR